MNTLNSAKSFILIYSLLRFESPTLRKPNFIYFTRGTTSVCLKWKCVKGEGVLPS